MPTIVLDSPGWLSVKRSTNSMRLMPSSSSSTPPAPSAAAPRPRPSPIGGTLQPLSSAGAPRAAPPRIRTPAPASAAPRDQLLVLALQRRVGDLEDVEDAHLDVVGEVRQQCPTCRGSGPCPRRAAAAISSIVPFSSIYLAARRHVDLDEVEVVGAQPAQALLDAGADVGGAQVVRVGRRRVRRRGRAGSRTWRRGSTRRGAAETWRPISSSLRP